MLTPCPAPQTPLCPAPQHSLHSLMGSSDQSRQSRAESHTLSKLMHSPLWHLNLLGPSHRVTKRGKENSQEGLSCRGLPKMTLGAEYVAQWYNPCLQFPTSHGEALP